MSGTILEKEVAAPTGTYSTVYAVGENQEGDKMMVRNTTTSRLQFRFAGDDDQVFTMSPDENIIIGGFSAMRGKLLEVRTVTDVPSSVRVNVYG